MLSSSIRILMLSWIILLTVGCYTSKSTDTSKDSFVPQNTDDARATNPPSNPETTGTQRPVQSDAESSNSVVPDQHRPVAEVCDDVRNPPEPYWEPSFDANECTVHADCVNGINGRCFTSRAMNICTYDTCFSDSDCGETVCLCGGDDVNKCLIGNCQVDADCGPKGYCSPSLGSCGNYGGISGYYCHTPEDECINDSECESESGARGSPYCAFNLVAGKWMCSSTHCVG